MLDNEIERAALEAAVADGVIAPMNDGSSKGKKSGLRRGKWTSEEEAYANRLIQEFKAGLLPLTDGTTLRTFLSKLLNCDPMRISKKFVGTNCIGKQVFRRRQQDLEKLSLEQIDMCRRELADLERRFLERVATTNRTKSVSKSSKDGRDDVDYMSTGAVDPIAAAQAYMAATAHLQVTPWMVPPHNGGMAMAQNMGMGAHMSSAGLSYPMSHMDQMGGMSQGSQDPSGMTVGMSMGLGPGMMPGMMGGGRLGPGGYPTPGPMAGHPGLGMLQSSMGDPNAVAAANMMSSAASLHHMRRAMVYPGGPMSLAAAAAAAGGQSMYFPYAMKAGGPGDMNAIRNGRETESSHHESNSGGPGDGFDRNGSNGGQVGPSSGVSDRTSHQLNSMEDALGLYGHSSRGRASLESLSAAMTGGDSMRFEPTSSLDNLNMYGVGAFPWATPSLGDWPGSASGMSASSKNGDKLRSASFAGISGKDFANLEKGYGYDDLVDDNEDDDDNEEIAPVSKKQKRDSRGPSDHNGGSGGGAGESGNVVPGQEGHTGPSSAGRGEVLEELEGRRSSFPYSYGANGEAAHDKGRDSQGNALGSEGKARGNAKVTSRVIKTENASAADASSGNVAASTKPLYSPALTSDFSFNSNNNNNNSSSNSNNNSNNSNAGLPQPSRKGLSKKSSIEDFMMLVDMGDIPQPDFNVLSAPLFASKPGEGNTSGGVPGLENADTRGHNGGDGDSGGGSVEDSDEGDGDDSQNGGSVTDSVSADAAAQYSAAKMAMQGAPPMYYPQQQMSMGMPWQQQQQMQQQMAQQMPTMSWAQYSQQQQQQLLHMLQQNYMHQQQQQVQQMQWQQAQAAHFRSAGGPPSMPYNPFAGQMQHGMGDPLGMLGRSGPGLGPGISNESLGMENISGNMNKGKDITEEDYANLSKVDSMGTDQMYNNNNRGKSNNSVGESHNI